MASVYKEGERVGTTGYKILKELSSGGMAIAYAAQSPKGEKVFFKQYKSPSVRKSWYKPYISYQKELKRRVESTKFKDFSYRFIDFFEYDRCYFQVFEFVEGGASLEAAVQRGRKCAADLSWSQRAIMAKVLMLGIHELHQAKIVHSDLKPANVILMPDDSITLKFRLRIIDLDFSLLADQEAPWHSETGYFGTDGYLSPEHLRNEPPVAASDVFTCGLMLYELLGTGHPYDAGDRDSYRTSVLAYRAKPPKLLDKMPGAAVNVEVEQILHRCLSPKLADRPTAKEVLHALNGDERDKSPAASTPKSATADATTAPEEPSGTELLRLVLTAGDGQEISFGARMEVGRTTCKRFGEDSQFWAEPQQFLVDRDGLDWVVIPKPDTRNQTLLNGEKIATRTRLKSGDVLAVGSEERAIVKLPLTVSYRPA